MDVKMSWNECFRLRWRILVRLPYIWMRINNDIKFFINGESVETSFRGVPRPWDAPVPDTPVRVQAPFLEEVHRPRAPKSRPIIPLGLSERNTRKKSSGFRAEEELLRVNVRERAEQVKFTCHSFYIITWMLRNRLCHLFFGGGASSGGRRRKFAGRYANRRNPTYT